MKCGCRNCRRSRLKEGLKKWWLHDLGSILCVGALIVVTGIIPYLPAKSCENQPEFLFVVGTFCSAFFGVMEFRYLKDWIEGTK